MGLLGEVDLKTFNEDDYKTIQNKAPPGRYGLWFGILAVRLHKIRPENSNVVSFARALNNAEELLARPDLEDHVREYLMKHRKY